MFNILNTPHTVISFSELTYWLALWRTPTIGPTRFLQLLEVFPHLADLFSTPSSQLSKLGLSEQALQSIQNPDLETISQELRWAEQPRHHILTWTSPEYPALLRQISNPPMVLFVQGDAALLSSPQIGIVGSRNPSPTGFDTARQFSRQLAQLGITITSGLALGIDAAAHRGALETNGKTIGVLGSGLQQIYPKSHKILAEQLIDHGALVSEYPLKAGPKAMHFPQRNRIVSGLSHGVLVVEATLRSGSLITARLAAEQGKDVFAIPGSIQNPLSSGCHFLIRQGAKLTENVHDILEELPMLCEALQAQTENATVNKNIQEEIMLEKTDKAVLDSVGFEMTTTDQLVERTGLAVDKLASALLNLELKGLIRNVPGGYMRVN